MMPRSISAGLLTMRKLCSTVSQLPTISADTNVETFMGGETGNAQGRQLAAIVVCLFLGGCGSLVGAQNSCDAANQNFVPMWDCIKGRIAANEAGMMNNSPGMNYVAYGNLLAEKVRSGSMSDAEAKSLLSQQLVRSEQDYQGMQPRRTTCQPLGNTVSCTTY
jgi:hypothetical protein